MSRAIKLVLILMMFIYTRKSLWAMLSVVDDNRILLDTVSGAVGWGNYSYWKLSHEGPLIIQVQSITGDADLYVSENEKPGFELDKYNYSSVTCGLDEVFIAADFPRPIGIAIYGHKPHELSEYTMSVEIDMQAIVEDWNRYANTGLVYEDSEGVETRHGSDETDRTRSDQQSDDSNSRSTKFIGLLSILDMLLEIFIL